MKKIYAFLTKIFDKLGLVRDTKDSSITDGLTHLFKGGTIHVLIVSVLIGVYNMLIGVYATWITTLIITFVLAYGEYHQEKAMMKKNPKRKFTFNKHRHQDIYLYTGFGLFFSILITVFWVMM